MGGAVIGYLVAAHPSLAPPVPADYPREALADLIRIFPGLLLFFGFGMYWNVAAWNSHPAKLSESSASRSLHQLLWSAAFILTVLPIPGLMAPILPRTPFWLATGLSLQTAATWLAIWARRHLGPNWSADVRLAIDHQLVQTGPYRRIRHPIYTPC